MKGDTVEVFTSVVAPEYKSRRKRASDVISMDLAHARLGHIAKKTISQMVKQGSAHGLLLNEVDDIRSAERCRTCVQANLKHQEVPKLGTRLITRPLQLVGTDLQTIETRSHDGKEYFVLYCDQKSQAIATVALARKSDQVDAAQKVLPRLETMAGCRIDTLRADQGGEYTSAEFRNFCQKRGIRIEYSDTNQPFQNGLAEISGSKLLRMMRAARAMSSVPKKYWTNNLDHQTWLVNRLSTTKQQGKTTPIEQLSGQKADLSRARVWGCEAWVLIRRSTKSKLSDRAERAVHLGVSLDKKAWTFLLWNSRKVVESRNAVFFEDSFPFKGEESQKTLMERNEAADLRLREGISNLQLTKVQEEHHNRPEIEIVGSNEEPEHQHDDEEDRQQQEHQDDVGVDNLSASNVDSERSRMDVIEDQQAGEVGLVNQRKSSRIRAKPLPFWKLPEESDEDNLEEKESEDILEASIPTASSSIEEEREPFVDLADEEDCLDEGDHAFTTFSDPKCEAEAWKDLGWREAERDEYKSLKDSDTFDIVPRPTDPDIQVLPSMVVYKTKQTDIESETKKKARFVVKGCCDKKKKEKQKFAPTLKFASLRMLFAIAAIFGATVKQMDVKTAFLNGDLPEPIYVEQPKNMPVGNPRNFVMKIKKSLYGLAEAPRLWNEKLDSELRAMGFKRLSSDPCLYAMHSTKGKGSRKVRHITMLGVYVDDILLWGTNKSLVRRVKTRLSEVFKMKDLGDARWALGVAIGQNETELTMDQKKYLKDVLIRFEEYISSKNYNPNTPLPPGIILTKKMSPETTGDIESMNNLPYRELIGSLMYLAVGTRPDIAFAMSVLSRFVSNPGEQHWNAALHVLRYLRGTPDHGLHYGRPSSPIGEMNAEILQALENGTFGYVDADWATDPETSKSISGQVFVMNGSAISWRSKQQSIIATSTCHAEYIAACEAARECVWLREMLSEMGFAAVKPTCIFEDNEAAIFLSNNPATTDRSKHIRLKWHYVRQCVKDQVLLLKKIETRNNAADTLTKPVSGKVLETFRKAVCLQPTSNVKRVRFKAGVKICESALEVEGKDAKEVLGLSMS